MQRRAREVIADVLAIVLGSEVAGEKNYNLGRVKCRRELATESSDDAIAIAVFLKSIPAVTNKVPGPFGANDKATEFVMKVVPGEGKQ